MNRSDGPLVQVALTGTRLAQRSDQELLAGLKTRFNLSEQQSAMLLRGRCVVKRGVDVASAEKLRAVLGEIGLEAVVENLKPPAAAPSPRKNTKPPLDALLSLANQRLPRPRADLPYLAGLLLVTLLCIALPLIYVGLIGGIAYGWFWYLTHIHEHLPRNVQLVALMYAVPGLTGAVLVLFLMRPLFARRPQPREVLKLDPEKEPGFVSGVHALCRAIGVSPPVEIRLSWDANASVQFRSPWLSFFTGHKILTIGMSLVGGLSARQFVGVLAHEFGHFAQRLGMICSFTVNSINAWLEHCAYGEDLWSQKIREWSDAAMEKDHWFSWVVYLSVAGTRIAIRGTRLLMAGLFHISFRLSRYMSRQMEFDADRYEALLAGSDGFRVTARSLRALNHAFAEVNGANIEAWQEHRLLRDLPEAVAAHAREYDAARLAKIEAEMSEETTTRYWDSHPPDVDRIENAEKRRSPGIYLEAAPASLLFRDFAGWSQRATRLFYTEHGVKFAAEQLRSREEIMGQVRDRGQQREQLNRFFNGQFQHWPLLQLRHEAAARIQPQPDWQDCIDQIRARSPEIARNWSNALQAQERRSVLRAAVILKASSRQMSLPGPDRPPQVLASELGDITAKRTEYHEQLEKEFAFYALRIQHAMEAMTPFERDQATHLRDTLISLGTLEREASALDEIADAIRVFGSIAENNGQMPPGFDQLESAFSDTASKLLTHADRIPQTVTTGGTVGGYLRARCPDLPPTGTRVSPTVLARACWPMPGAFQHLYLLTLGELVSLCESAEKKCGIRPIRLVA
jgi:Zn-dependent protease with chaperone function